MTKDTDLVAVETETGKDIRQYERLSPAEQQEAQELARQLDARNSLRITTFAVDTQREVSAVTDSLLNVTATKDADVGGVLTDLMLQLKALDTASLAAQTESALARLPLLGALFDKVRQLILRYESVNAKIERTTVALDNARNGLSRNIIVLDQLYDKNKTYARRLRIAIGAGELKLQELGEARAALAAEAAAAQDPMLAQQASDLANTSNQLEVRLHDLKLAGTLALQTATQLRVIQSGSQALVGRIQSSILTTIPLWRIQMCIAIALVGQARAIKVQQLVSATTNRLITANADKIRALSGEAHTAAQQGIVAIETLQHANSQLIATIEESLQIQEAGRQKRMEAEQVLEKLNDELKHSLIKAQQASDRTKESDSESERAPEPDRERNA